MKPTTQYRHALGDALGNLENAQDYFKSIKVTPTNTNQVAATKSRLNLIKELITVGVE